MRHFLQRILTQPVIKLANRWSSRPDKGRVFEALSKLYEQISNHKTKRGLVIPFHPLQDKFIIFSDQHKGTRNEVDDFAMAERNYLTALQYYNEQGYTLICLGDSEELWKNRLEPVRKHNQNTFAAEQQFLQRGAFIKVFGNHDLYWDNDPLAPLTLKGIYGQEVKIYEGLILKALVGEGADVYLTHGHQGDLQSDGNWFSKWFVANVWERLQAYLRINPNTPANNDDLKTLHNTLMYEWSAAQSNLLLITGHTHQPVFASVTHIERLYILLDRAKAAADTAIVAKLQAEIDHRHLKGDASLNFKGYKDTYFNSGCCCYNDGDITGIEIADGCIRLIKWEYDADNVSGRYVLEESKLADLKL
ncbi:metallophosphoesterase [Mucilaginibacter koreensis]